MPSARSRAPYGPNSVRARTSPGSGHPTAPRRRCGTRRSAPLQVDGLAPTASGRASCSRRRSATARSRRDASACCTPSTYSANVSARPSSTSATCTRRPLGNGAMADDRTSLRSRTRLSRDRACSSAHADVRHEQRARRAADVAFAAVVRAEVEHALPAHAAVPVQPRHERGARQLRDQVVGHVDVVVVAVEHDAAAAVELRTAEQPRRARAHAIDDRGAAARRRSRSAASAHRARSRPSRASVIVAASRARVVPASRRPRPPPLRLEQADVRIGAAAQDEQPDHPQRLHSHAHALTRSGSDIARARRHTRSVIEGANVRRAWGRTSGSRSGCCLGCCMGAAHAPRRPGRDRARRERSRAHARHRR